MFFRKVLKNILWLLSEQGIRVSLGLISTSVLARQLGVEQYGLFQYTISLVAIFSSVGFICGGEVLVPLLVHTNNKENKRELMGNAFALRLFFSIFAYFILLFFSFIVESAQQFLLIALFGLSMLFVEAFAVITNFLQSETYIKPRSILVMLSLSIKTVLLVVLSILKINNIYLYALVVVLDPIFVALGLLYVYYKLNDNTLFFQYSFAYMYRLFKAGIPFFIGLVSMFVFMRLDIVMVKKYISSTELGYYTAAKQLIAQIIAVSPIIVMSLAPTFIYNKKCRRTIIKNTLCISAGMLLFGVSAALILQLMGLQIINILFGVKYLSTVKILSGLSWAVCLLLLNEGLNLYLLKMQRGDLITIKWIIVLFVSVLLYSYLIPLYGSYGAILGYAGGYLVACIYGFWALFYAKKNTRY